MKALLRISLLCILTFYPVLSLFGQDGLTPQQITKTWDSVKEAFYRDGSDNEYVINSLDLINRTLVSKMASIMSKIIPPSEDILEGRQLIEAYEYVLSGLIGKGEESFLQVNKLLNDRLLSSLLASQSPDNYFDYSQQEKEGYYLSRMDLFSRRAYYKAILDIFDDNTSLFKDHWSLLTGLMHKLRNAYSSVDELFHCYLHAVNSFGWYLTQAGQNNYGMIVLYSILNKTTCDPFDDKPCDEESKELLEYTRTQLCYLASKIGEDGRLYSLVEESIGYDYYNVNNLLQQRTIYFRTFPEQAFKERMPMIKETEEILKKGYKGQHGAGIWRSGCYSTLCDVYRLNGELDKAKRHCETSLKIDGEYFSLDHNITYAWLLYDTKYYSLAQEVCLQCINHINTSPYQQAVVKYLDDMYLLLCQISLDSGNNENLTEYATSYVTEYKNTILRETRYLSPSQLYDYWLNSTDGGAGADVMAKIASVDVNGSGPLYDVLLFNKDIVVKLSSRFRENIMKSGDEELIKEYESYLSLVRDCEPDDGELQLIEKRLSLLYSKHYEFNTAPSISWRDVQKMLGKNDIAIEFSNYIVGEKNPELWYCAVVLRPGYDKPHFVKICSHKRLFELWGKDHFGDYPMFYEDYRLKTASEFIWGPLEKELSSVKNIYYSTDMLLSQMNLDILNHPTKGKRMNECFEMCRLSSTGELCSTTEGKSSSSIALIGAAQYGLFSTKHVGGDEIRGLRRGGGWEELPGSEEEIRSISSQIPPSWQSTVKIGKEATEQSVTGFSGHSPDILHIATHGFYFSEKSARSWPYYKSYENTPIPEEYRVGLVFSIANPSWLYLGKGLQDGTLTAHEIVGLDLSNTSIVTLSSCQSGIGEWYRDGSYGLQRTFKIAGCKTIIMSLWPVGDQTTCTFMNEFYKALFKGTEKHKAFKNAQNKVKKEDPSPMAWGAFVMVD